MSFIAQNNMYLVGGQSSLGGLLIPESNPDGYFIIEHGNQSSGADNHYHFQKNGAVYQVTAGKIGYPKMVFWAQNSGSNVTIGQIITASNNFTEGAGSGSVTIVSRQFGGDTRYGMLSAAAGVYYSAPLSMTFAASSYVGIQLLNATVRHHVLILMKEA